MSVSPIEAKGGVTPFHEIVPSVTPLQTTATAPPPRPQALPANSLRHRNRPPPSIEPIRLSHRAKDRSRRRPLLRIPGILPPAGPAQSRTLASEDLVPPSRALLPPTVPARSQRALALLGFVIVMLLAAGCWRELPNLSRRDRNTAHSVTHPTSIRVRSYPPPSKPPASPSGRYYSPDPHSHAQSAAACFMLITALTGRP